MNYEQAGDTPINLVIVFTVVLTLLTVALILEVAQWVILEEPQ